MNRVVPFLLAAGLLFPVVGPTMAAPSVGGER